MTKRVAAGDTDVLRVKVFSDGDWAFLDGGSADPDDVVLLHLHHLLESDPSLEEMRTLQPGAEARRWTPGEPWSVLRHDD
ncbi:MAG: hypothetical protein ACRD12_15930 [Acidimicrobiales bacterium]